MQRILLTFLIALAGLGLVVTGAEAKRLGGGTTSGLKRQAPAPQPAQPVPAKPAAAPETPPAAAAAPAAAPKRSWLGPIAGIAAGLGLAALMSHFGMGEGMSSILTILLIAGGLFFVARWLMQRFGPAPARPTGLQYAAAGIPPAALPPQRLEPVLAAARPAVPASFDAPGFERVAKLIFIRMQAANDAANLDDLRQFSTPEMFANFRLDLQDRKTAPQQTDVVELEAKVIEVAEEGARQIVSVRFHGLIREEAGTPPAPFDEVWHLTRPADGSAEWAIAGIAQAAVA